MNSSRSGLGRSLRRLLAILALSTALTAGAVTQAQAMPAAIGAVAAFAGSSAIGGIVVDLAVGAIASLGSSLLKNLLGGSQQPKGNLGIRLSVAAGGVIPQSIIMGTRPTAGSICYRGSWGEANGAPNAYYVEERVLADKSMPVLSGFWIGETKGTLLTGEADADKGIPVSQFRRGGVDHLWVKYRAGTATTADAYLRAKFGSHATRPYTTTMIGRGQASVIVTRRLPVEANRDLFAGNLEYKFETTGIPLYNLAKDSTAGGSGTHRRNDETTWEPSTNLAVQIYNALIGVYYGTEWLFGLQNLHLSALPASSWIAAINACSTTVAKQGGGTEPAYAGGLEIAVDTPAVTVIEEQLNGCSGRMAEIGGIYKILVGAPGAAVFSYTDDDLIVSRPQQYEPFPRPDDTFNGIRAKYPEPAAGWVLKDAPARYNAGFEASDGGRHAVDVTYLAVSSVTQVQRLNKATAEEQRRWRKHREVLPPIGSELEPLDVVSKTSVRNGYVSKDFLITDVDDEPTYLTPIVIQELDPNDYDWDAATEEQPSSVGTLEVYVPPSQTIIGWAVAGVTIPDTANNARRPAIEFTWNGAIEDVRSVGFQVARTASEATLVFEDSTDNVVAGVKDVASAAILPNQNLYARGRYYSRSGSWTSDWTAWLPVTTPDIRTDFLDLNAAVQGDLRWISQSLADSRRNIEAVALRIQDSTWNTDATFKRIRSELVVARGEDKATFESEITVAIGYFDDGIAAVASIVTALGIEVHDPSSGLAATAASLSATQLTVSGQGTTLSAHGTRLDGIDVSVGNISAGGLVKFETAAGPGGGWARYVARVYSGVGGTLGAAAFFLEAKSDGSGRGGFYGQTMIFADSSGNIYSMFDAATGAYFNEARIINLKVDNLMLRGAGGYVGIDADLYLKLLSATTGVIAANAISNIYSSGTDGSVAVGSPSYTTIVTVSSVVVPANSSGVLVNFTACGWTNVGADVSSEFQLKRNGTVIKAFDGSWIFNGGSSTSGKQMLSAYTYVDAPGTGMHTYLVEARCREAGLINSSGNFNNRRMVCSVLNR